MAVVHDWPIKSFLGLDLPLMSLCGVQKNATRSSRQCILPGRQEDTDTEWRGSLFPHGSRLLAGQTGKTEGMWTQLCGNVSHIFMNYKWMASWKNRICSTTMKLRNHSKSQRRGRKPAIISSCSVHSPEIVMHNDAFNVMLWTSADMCHA